MRSKWISQIFFALIVSAHAFAAPFPRGELPEPLKTWVPWVLDGDPKSGCPHLFNSADTRHCAWPGALDLKANGSGAGFTQEWQVYRETWAALPGDAQQWPERVHVDGKPVAVLSREGVPSVRLGPGAHLVTGLFVWAALPESLALADSDALLRLDVDGRAVALPVRDDSNRLWLQRKADLDGAEQMQLQVYRKVVDGVPIVIETRLRLDVSGKSREIAIERALLADWIPKELVSPLPAALGQDGSLKIQARAGTWEIALMARHPAAIKAVLLPLAEASAAVEEVWVFEAAPLLRTVSVEGPAAVDPQQTTLPPEWRRLPAYLMRPGATFGLKEVRRGDADPAPDKLSLERRMWLGFDGSTLTLSDRIQGEMSRPARLTMGGSAQLGRVDVGGQDQLITSGLDKLPGIEVKRGPLALSADSLVRDAPRSLPAVGWKHDFDRVSMELALPAGWRLLHASGVDRADGAWLSRWNLLDFFLVLVIALAAGRLWGAGWGLVALAALVLSYQEAGAPRYVWLLLLAAVALARALPEGRLKAWVGRAERLSLLLLVLIVLGFATSQVRSALYPVLELGAAGGFGDAIVLQGGALQDMAAPAPASPQAVPPEIAEEATNQNLPAVRAKGKTDASPLRSGKPASMLEKKSIAPSQRQYSYQNLDPAAKVQTGPGLPDWRWHHYRLVWDGPVRQDQQLGLWLLPPWGNKILVLLRLMLLGLLLARIAGLPMWPDRRGQSGAKGTWGRWFARSGMTTLMLLLAMLHGEQAYAQLPDEEMLSQLKEKILRPADCLPECAELSRLSVQALGSSLRLGLEIDAAIDTALPLPGGVKHWLPREALLDGKSAHVHRDRQGGLWLLAPAGRHRAELIGELPVSDILQLPLPRKPRRVDVRADDWDVAGLSDTDGAADTLQLTRRRKAGMAADAPALPPFLLVERRLVLDLLWRVETTVRRASPLGVPALAQIPLLPGEAVTSSGVTVKDGKVLLNLGPQADALSWSSTLAQRPELVLVAAKETSWVETWTLAASTLWHVRAEGFAPVAMEGNLDADMTFRPWPGETLKLKIDRPEAVAGQTLTIDSSRLVVAPGNRATDYQLTLVARSSRGLEHIITLPEGASLQRVAIGGQVRPIRASGRQIVLPLVPGKQNIELAWRVDQGIGLSYLSKPVGINLVSVNSRLELKLPHDRWLLLATGPGMGPAILFWGKLLVLLSLAVLLGRYRGLPMKTLHWLLLAVGMTQIAWWAAVIVVGWFFALDRRAGDADKVAQRWLFNLRQLALVVLTLALLAALFGTVQSGLLGRPDMQIEGNNSSASLLRWYLDRAAPELTPVWVFSLPMLAYRGLMLGWALWLAWSLPGWLKWGWGSFGQGGLWRKKPPAKPVAEQQKPPATGPLGVDESPKA